jgi:hypothetical protein
MTIELTEAQRQALQAFKGRPVDVVDPATKERFVLLDRGLFDRMRNDRIGRDIQSETDWIADWKEFWEKQFQWEAERPHRIESAAAALGVSSGILWSQTAFWNDLAELLRNKKNLGQWVCYSRDDRIGIGSYEELIRKCVRRGLSENEYDLQVIEPRASPPWEPEEIEAGGNELDNGE